jgi:tRNA U34 2-thiouridine synthase MnmA/TrmU
MCAVYCLLRAEKYGGNVCLLCKCRWKCIDSGNISNDNSRRSIGKIKVSFKDKQRAITKGQSVVFYDGNLVVGGGIIEKIL